MTDQTSNNQRSNYCPALCLLSYCLKVYSYGTVVQSFYWGLLFCVSKHTFSSTFVQSFLYGLQFFSRLTSSVALLSEAFSVVCCSFFPVTSYEARL